MSERSYGRWASKLEWALSLKVGDVICDCRLKHLKIKEIEVLYGLSPFGLSLYWRLPDWLPFWVDNLLRSILERCFEAPNDVDVVLEDGAACSILPCGDSLELCDHED